MCAQLSRDLLVIAKLFLFIFLIARSDPLMPRTALVKYENQRLQLTYKENADVLRHVESCCTHGHHYRHDDRHPHDATLMPHHK